MRSGADRAVVVGMEAMIMVVEGDFHIAKQEGYKEKQGEDQLSD